jgi:Tetratricopeptide repeat/Glycosyltransferase family 9 (heptosyltransferase)
MFGQNALGTMQVLSENSGEKVEVSDPLKDTRETYEKGEFGATVDKATAFIRANPQSYAAWVLRGAALSRLESHYSAILNFTKAISINPNIYDAWNNRGLSHFRLQFWREAITDFETAISLNEGNYVSQFQLGLLYGVLDRPVQSEFHLREAAARVPETDDNHVIVNIFLATLLQGLGKWEEGFERDQNRFKLERQKFLAPMWKGEDLTGKHILVFTEAGWGDKILSLRYIDYLFEKYPDLKITVGTQPDLTGIVHSTFGNRVTVTNTVVTDYSISLLDVPMVLKLTWDTVPRPVKYLTIDPRRVEKWGLKFKELPRGINVGLCWASLNGISKTIPPWDMIELGGVPQVNFISLQKPYREHPRKELKLIDWTDEINDWSDTGAIIENCDIVISIDTGVAHLAGALGKPVWTIVRFSTYWPWMALDIPPSPDYSIWYPSMTLFRQRNYGDWLGSIRSVTLALQGQLAGLT